MLQSFRERMQGIIASAIVVLVCITFALWGIQNYLHGGGDHDTVAKVNGEKITQKQLHSAYERMQRREMMQLGDKFSLDQKAQEALKKQVLQQLINNEVVSQAANKLGFAISQQQLTGAIAQLPVFQDKGVFSPEKFQQILTNLSYSETDFINELQRSLILNQLEIGIASSAFMLPYELDNAIKLINQKRDFGYFNISNEKFSNDTIVKDDEIQNFYNQHKNEYVSPEKISIEYIQLSADEMKDKIKVSDADLQKFYQDNIARYTIQKKPAQFNSIKSRVKDDFVHQQLFQSFSEQNDKLTDLVYTNSDSLIPAAKALGLEVKTTDLFTKDGDKTGIISNQKIVKAAFSEQVLKQGYNSVPIELNSGNIVTLRIKKHIAEATLPLDQVKDSIVLKLKAVKMQEAAKNLGAQILKELQNGSDPMVLAKKYNLAWNVSANVDRKEKNINPALINCAFGLSANMSTGIDIAGKSYAVIKVLKIYDGELSTTNEAERKSIKEDLEAKYGRFEYSLLMDELTKKAKIVVEDKNLTATTDSNDDKD